MANNHYFGFMKLVLYQISDVWRNVIKTFFSSDLELMSDEVKQILSNPEDAEKYRNALKEIKEDSSKEVTIELSNHDHLTLIQ